MTSQLKKIRLARGLSQAEVADELGIATENYNKLENGKTEFTYRRMCRLAAILNVEPADFVSKRQGARTVRVIAFVEAGVWKETREWPEDECYDVSIPDDPGLRAYRLFGAETRGPSMNKIFPEGTIVIFNSLIDTRSQPEIGNRYIVDRERADGRVESTVKMLDRDDDGKYWLIPESSDPRFQNPIAIDGNEGDTVKIKGKVVYSIRPEY